VPVEIGATGRETVPDGLTGMTGTVPFQVPDPDPDPIEPDDPDPDPEEPDPVEPELEPEVGADA